MRDGFNVALFRHAVRLLIIAQDILVDMAGYPTESIATNSHDYRPLGLGYANLGALLMSLGLAYDSEEGREMAAAITALMGGAAYLASAEIAANGNDLVAAGMLRDERAGSFPGYLRNREPFLGVIRRHRAVAENNLGQCERSVSYPVHYAAVGCWDEALELGARTGFRNSQVTVLAPTGTIGFMMDCDTTGIEPMLGVVVFKKLVGGGISPWSIRRFAVLWCVSAIRQKSWRRFNSTSKTPARSRARRDSAKNTLRSSTARFGRQRARVRSVGAATST